MNQKGNWRLGFGIVLLLVTVMSMFLYASMAGPRYDSLYAEGERQGKVNNPVQGLSIGEYPEVDETFVRAFLISLKAYNLHFPPLSSELPEFDVVVDDITYHAMIVSGAIVVKQGKGDYNDIILRTTAFEMIAILQDSSKIHQSFRSGNSRIEYITDGSTLLFKGYYAMTSGLTGTSLTGNVIRGYLS